ncbi:GGDEF domain-containing protein [Marinobacterium jannaschii]|uniref:GGDEF domain-containing protein n=1 Tax=Marinobacterium jannaschii TaxID=64970 RepID=UPI0012EBF2DC|nr:diguanylate cyclase [Marinobacterium jannaschii]
MFLTLGLIVLPNVELLEKQALIKDMVRVKKQLESTQKQLHAFARDYAEWDETYAFMDDRNDSFAQSNLVAGTLNAAKADILLLFDPDGQARGQLYSQAAVDLLGELRISRYLLEVPDSPDYGFIRMGDQVLMFAQQPITDSDVSQPPRGVLFFLRFVDSQMARSISENLGFDVSLSIGDRSSAEERIEVGFFGGDRSLAWHSIDLLLEPRFVLTIRLVQSRPFYAAAWETMAWALLSLLVMGGLLSVGVFYYLNRNLVRPIQALKQQADHYGESGDPTILKTLRRSDELGMLSESFVKMAASLESHRRSLETERQQYLDASYTDALTGLKNRRFLDQYLKDCFARGGADTWLFVFFDLDHFKHVNDRYGHDVGDIALKQLAGLVQSHSREGDIVVRQGGEEFVLLCNGSDLAQARQIVERIRTEVSAYLFGPPGRAFHMTCSLGFCLLRPAQCIEDISVWYEMLKAADLSLYGAKRSGRNTWVGVSCQDQDVLRKDFSKVDLLTEEVAAGVLTLHSSLPLGQPVDWHSGEAQVTKSLNQS